MQSTLISSSFFFFKQKTAYEMLISDWSSDVCSSDLNPDPSAGRSRRCVRHARHQGKERLSHVLQEKRAALRAHAGAGDAVPTRRPALGRADRVSTGAGTQLAADGIRWTRADGGHLGDRKCVV